jgi:hypothetical protein
VYVIFFSEHRGLNDCTAGGFHSKKKTSQKVKMTQKQSNKKAKEKTAKTIHTKENNIY